MKYLICLTAALLGASIFAVADPIHDKCVSVAASDKTMPPEYDDLFVAKACGCISKVADGDDETYSEIDRALQNAEIAERLAALTSDTRTKVEACLTAPDGDAN